MSGLTARLFHMTFKESPFPLKLVAIRCRTWRHPTADKWPVNWTVFQNISKYLDQIPHNSTSSMKHVIMIDSAYCLQFIQTSTDICRHVQTKHCTVYRHQSKKITAWKVSPCFSFRIRFWAASPRPIISLRHHDQEHFGSARRNNATHLRMKYDEIMDK